MSRLRHYYFSTSSSCPSCPCSIKNEILDLEPHLYDSDKLTGREMGNEGAVLQGMKQAPEKFSDTIRKSPLSSLAILITSWNVECHRERQEGYYLWKNGQLVCIPLKLEYGLMCRNGDIMDW